VLEPEPDHALLHRRGHQLVGLTPDRGDDRDRVGRNAAVAEASGRVNREHVSGQRIVEPSRAMPNQEGRGPNKRSPHRLDVVAPRHFGVQVDHRTRPRAMTGHWSTTRSPSTATSTSCMFAVPHA
jgi:hypothetical protein